jgi:uncharacterized protein
MPEVIFNGPEGRLEGRYQMSKKRGAPIALLLHPHPQFGGTINFRGIGRSQGVFDHGSGELADAASALDWAQAMAPEAKTCWVAGVSFGAWIGMQLLMRRPEIEGFLSIAAMANRYDYTFLAPCPSSGLFVHGENDRVSPSKESMSAIDKVKTQKGIRIEHQIVPGANHFFEGKMDELMGTIGTYLDKRMDGKI